MISSDALIPIFEAFRIADQSFTVALKAIDLQHEDTIKGTDFHNVPQNDAVASIQRARGQASDLAVLALFATFERQIIEHLQVAQDWISSSGYPVAYAARLGERFKAKVERWGIEEILGLFKPEVDDAAIEDAKAIKKYRDWIAHQNPNNPAPPPATPDTAFSVLTDVINQIATAHTPGM
ncbi:TPA: hypothetical protein QDB31_004826 [Burkholderia vietnamiensis]|nr:hypothetical protein [Burkholderia vietnamiensis]